MGIAMMPQIGWSGTPDFPKAAPLWAFEFFNHLINPESFVFISDSGKASAAHSLRRRRR
jgi:hypothetical protein